QRTSCSKRQTEAIERGMQRRFQRKWANAPAVMEWSGMQPGFAHQLTSHTQGITERRLQLLRGFVQFPEEDGGARCAFEILLKKRRDLLPGSHRTALPESYSRTSGPRERFEYPPARRGRAVPENPFLWTRNARLSQQVGPQIGQATVD